MRVLLDQFKKGVIGCGPDGSTGPAKGRYAVNSHRVPAVLAPSETRRGRDEIQWSRLVVAASVVLLAASVSVGADADWLVALGELIRRSGHVPTGIPFAAATSSHWVNVPVLGELVFASLHRVGPLALPVTQLIVDAAALLLVARGARRLGASDGPTAAVLAVLLVGTLPALGVVRAQLMSLLPFVALAALLRAEQIRPSRRVWLTVPLVVLWGNLHGAVLVGVALAACYLIVSRMRLQPMVAVLVLAATVSALWVNPAGAHTLSYYTKVMANEAARRGTGLWAPIDLSSPFDQLLILAALILLALLIRARRPAWEYAAAAGLAIATATSARYGVWLLLFCGPPAAVSLTAMRAFRRPQSSRPGEVIRTVRRAVVTLVVIMMLATVVLVKARLPRLKVADNDAVAIRSIAAGRVVLAPEPLAETLAAGGVRVWLSNPIDAFSQGDQAAYLDFLDGRGAGAARAFAAAGVVVVARGSRSAGLVAGYPFTFVDQVDGFDVLVRR